MAMRPERLRAGGLVVLSGGLLALSFPKFGTGLAAWIALVPLLASLEGLRGRRAFAAGFFAGVIAYAGILYWVAYAVVMYGNLPLAAGLAALFVLSSYLALYPGLFALAAAFFQQRNIPLLVGAPVAWVALEYGKSTLLTGFPWANLGCSQQGFLPLIQVADLTGVYGISFAVVFVNAALYEAWQGRNGWRIPLSRAVLVFAVLCCLAAYGLHRLDRVQEALAQAPSVPVALIQGSIDQSVKWNPFYQEKTVAIYNDLTRAAAVPPGGLVVWPETATPFYVQDASPLRDRIVDTIRRKGVWLLVGSPSHRRHAEGVAYQNSAFLFSPEGTIQARYDKVHLVPYGEYVPLRDWFPFLGKIAAGVGDFLPGSGYEPLEQDGLRLGVLICYEGIFTDAGYAYGRRGAQVLVNITNDAWYGRTSAPWQHLALAVFRAVETRLFLMRAANTGISALVAPTGQITAQTGLYDRTSLSGEARLLRMSSFYRNQGDVFAWTVLAALAGLLAWAGRRRS